MSRQQQHQAEERAGVTSRLPGQRTVVVLALGLAMALFALGWLARGMAPGAALAWALPLVTAAMLLAWRARGLMAQASEEKGASRERARALVEYASDAILVIDYATGRILEANRHAGEMLKMPVSGLIGTVGLDWMAPRQAGGKAPLEHGRHARKLAHLGDVTPTEWLLRDSTGHEFPVEMRFLLLPDSARKLARISLIDISGLRAAELARARALDRLQLLMESMPIAHITRDADMRVTAWNHAAERTFGYSAAEIIGTNAVDLTTEPAARATVLARLEQMRDGIDRLHSRNPSITKDGRRIVCDWYHARITDENGMFAGLIAMAVEATQQVEAEQALQESEARFRQLTELSSDWYWETDTEFRQTRLTGRNVLPGLAKNGLRAWEQEAWRVVGTDWDTVRATLGQKRSIEELLIESVGPNRERRYWLLRGEPAFGADGSFIGYRGVGSDITRSHRDNALRSGEKALFEALLGGAGLEQLMNMWCRTVEAVLPTSGKVALLLNESGMPKFLAGPGLPASYRAALEAGAGPCGVAVGRDAVTVVADIAADAGSAGLHAVAAAAGLRSCWATPVTGVGGAVIATLVVYRESTGEPGRRDIEMARAMAGVVGVVIERFRTEAALKESEIQYRSLVELSQDGILIHINGIIDYANPAFVRLVGADSAESLKGRDVYDFITAAGRQVGRSRVASLSRTGSTRLAPYIELQIQRLDGNIVDVEVAAARVDFDARRLIQSQFRDISARKWTEREILRLNQSLEERVEARTSELSAANRELEAFSYMVAHDLRAPLRAIDGFAGLLRMDLEGQLGEQSARDLAAVSANAIRMGRLIDGLLDFSRLSRGELNRQRVDTGAMVAAIIAELDPRQRAWIEVGALPEMLGDALMLRQAWVNLISNALKFSSRQAAPLVFIDAEIHAEENVFRVTDNGAGFDMAYAGKLFGAFQRLHSNTEFEGSGVGLAIVKRIVERHGGRVWAEGKTGFGATFHFALPNALPFDLPPR